MAQSPSTSETVRRYRVGFGALVTTSIVDQDERDHFGSRAWGAPTDFGVAHACRRICIPASTARPVSEAALKIMALRRDGQCGCGKRLAAGERAAWDRVGRVVVCLDCMNSAANASAITTTDPPIVDEPSISAETELGVAGASAQAEFDRRRTKRESRIREAHPRLGGLIMALTDEPQSTRAWESGAAGERRLATKLAELDGTVVALHDRSVPRSRANIDHIVVGPRGVFVIDAKRYKDASISVRRSGGIFGPAREQLMVGGRDKTKLVDAMTWQVDAVRLALSSNDAFLSTRVIPALCFIDGQFPLFGSVDIQGVHVRGLRGLAKLVSAEGPLDADARDRIARHLAEALPSKGV